MFFNLESINCEKILAREGTWTRSYLGASSDTDH